MMSKKTANDLMAEYIASIDSFCPFEDKCCEYRDIIESELMPGVLLGPCNFVEKASQKQHAECLKEYFQQQADIPDGWKIVKEIKQMCEDEQLVSNYEEDNYEAGFNDAKYDIIDFINQKLQEAEIGVKDENK